MLTWIRCHLEKEARELGIAPEKLTFLKRIGGDLSPGGKALFEILGPLSPRPLWVLKAARSSQGNAGLLAEYHRLEHLVKILPPPSLQTAENPAPPRVPHPVLFEERPHGSMSVETFLPGLRLSQLLQQDDPMTVWGSWEKAVKPAITGLYAYCLHEPRRSVEIDAQWWIRRLIGPLTPHDQFLAALCDGWPQVWTALQECCDWYFSGEMAPQHGDYTPANLVLEGGRIGVFDWSWDDQEAPPLLDLFQFLASASLFLGKRSRQGQKSAEPVACPLLEDDFLKLAARPVTCYLKACDLPSQSLAPLSLASLGLKILHFLKKPAPSADYLPGWVWTTSEWIRGGGVKKLISFVNDENSA